MSQHKTAFETHFTLLKKNMGLEFMDQDLIGSCKADTHQNGTRWLEGMG